MFRRSSIMLAPAIGLALVLGLSLGGCDRESGTKAQPQAENNATAAAAGQKDPVSRQTAGEALPTFTAKDPSGKVLDLAMREAVDSLVAGRDAGKWGAEVKR